MYFSRRASVTLIAGATLATAALGSNEFKADDEHYCAVFTKVRQNLSVKFGDQIDPLTRFSGLEVICNEKAMVFRQEIALESRHIDSGWIDRRTKYWSKTYCQRHPAFAGAIRTGWTIATVFTLADGQSVRIDASCHDAQA